MFYRNGRVVFDGIGGIGDAAAQVPMQIVEDAIAAAEAAAAQAVAAAHAHVPGALVLRASSATTPVVKDQQSICSSAAQAVARGNPAAPGLVQQCNELRAQNVAAGQLAIDGYAINGELRGELVKSGQRIAASDPKLAAAASRTTIRGFFMGIAVARAPARDPGYAAAIRASLSAVDAAGFDAGIAQASPTQQAGNGASDEGGIPRAVIIGGAAVGVLALAAAIYKFTR